MSSNNHKLYLQQSDRMGELQETYSPLQNLIKNDTIGEFTTSELSYNLKNFVNIDAQLSYDDSINLILNNNEDSPRIINTQFRVLGNKYEYITRNQSVSTNLYSEDTLKTTSDLYLRSKEWPVINLESVTDTGQLMGGNYVFYVKYCDEDMNESEIVSESGCVTVFKGNLPSNIHGTLLDERTNKSIKLRLFNLDQAFSQFYIYFSRETSDLNGISLTKYYKIVTPYSRLNSNIINITGYENIIEVSDTDIFTRYNYFSSAKTQAVVQNMLFFGNVQTSERNYPALQQASYKIKVTLRQKESSIGYVESDYASDKFQNNEYYNPNNIYYYLGYWPDEYYSLGICYILSDGTVTNSFPLYGKALELNVSSLGDIIDDTPLQNGKLLNDEYFDNTAGVFKLPNVEIIDHNNKTVCPLYFEFQFSQEAVDELLALGVEGYFFTRTKRVPTSLFQGFSVGIDPYSGIPLPYVSAGVKSDYIAESFLTENRLLENNIDKHLRSIKTVNNHGLLSVDAMVNPQLQSLLTWNDYLLQEEYKCSLEVTNGLRTYYITNYKRSNNNLSALLAYITGEMPSFKLDEFYFSTKVGSAESVRDFSFLETRNLKEEANNLLRGNYCPVVGTNQILSPSTIYTVKTKLASKLEWIKTLMNGNYPYFSITNRFHLTADTVNQKIEAYRGDCFTNTVTIRINRNFIDPTVPGNNEILDPKTWETNYKGSAKMNDKEVDENSWHNINLSDINAVPLGIWVTFKCLSNYNLGLRSIDTRDIDLINTVGGKRSFYPVSLIDMKSSGKVPESQVLNAGYSVTLSRNNYSKWITTPYENWNFENRIAFSNIAATKMFTNGFRIFQGMAYQDVDKQFGQIVKLFPYGQNLLCVFEHGLAVVPVNEKALLSTQEGLSIHLYGAGVLQEQVSVISPDYGSTWMESLIKTPNAYYGVDTSAKKIWKFNNAEGFVCISDFKMQSFLNENLHISNSDRFFMGATNVRTHYNNFKGDVIFTFYNGKYAYSICYNELTKTWVSRYTWMPLLSANIDNHFYSFGKDAITKYASLFHQTMKTEGIICEDPIYKNKVSFTYKSIVPAQLKLKSITYQGNIYYPNNQFVPILQNSEEETLVQGIYYTQGIKDLFYLGGSISKGISLSNKPLYGSETIPICLYSPDPITSDMIPSKTFVYAINNELTIVPESWYNWSVVAPSAYNGWYYIYTNVTLTPTKDSDGNMWLSVIITDGWSEPKVFTPDEVAQSSTSWKQIVNHTEKGDIYQDINFDKNEMLPLCYIAHGKTIGNKEYISSVPIIIDPSIEAEDELDYTEKSIYSVYLWYDLDTSKYNVHIPNYIIVNGLVDITLEAWYDNKVIEECTYTISNSISTVVNLYKHDITAPITHWYDNQEPFEYEFVVNQPNGINKIFNDLIIISNNVEPNSLEVEVIGDIYDFKESIIQSDERLDLVELNNITIRDGKSYTTSLKYNKTISEYSFLMHQDCMNIVDFGRRLGNISYIEGKWHAVLQPIYYKNKTSRLRDKWAKIRIKYSGEKLAIITAIQTLMNISHG